MHRGRRKTFLEPNFERAVLLVTPMGIKWREWREVLGALGNFVDAWECVALEYSVSDETRTAWSPIASGHLLAGEGVKTD